jgi:alpha-L-fucosidase
MYKLSKQLVSSVAIAFIIPITAASAENTIHYLPTQQSLSQHKIPEWYEDAKFGIMIHYGLYSVPGWAPLFNPTDKIFTDEFFVNNPYSEWYFNTMQIKGSPTYNYHLKTYGANFRYDDFIPLFNQALTHWNPDDWSKQFSKAHAKYVVFVTKHRDGFMLWPSKFENPYKKHYHTDRDVVGELTTSVRQHNMYMGIYYNGDDWTWQAANNFPVTNLTSLLENRNETEVYAEYVNNQWHELIETYHPDLIWNDFALTEHVNRPQLMADYYNSTPTGGVINNRWNQGEKDFSISGQPLDILLDWQLTYAWFDYYTPEYLAQYRLTRHKWEADHGPGYSFGYNRQDFEETTHLKTPDQVIVDLADIVSKNGNLLLAISPEADGTIPVPEQEILAGMSAWLDLNGESIFATRTWKRAEGKTGNPSIDVRFTQSKDKQHLYAILLTNPHNQTVTIKQLIISDKNTRVEVLNGEQAVAAKWSTANGDVKITFAQTNSLPTEHPLVIKFTPEPT